MIFRTAIKKFLEFINLSFICATICTPEANIFISFPFQAGAYEYEEEGEKGGANKKPNGLPIWGNEKSMNLNPLILTNIQSSQYFKGR